MKQIGIIGDTGMVGSIIIEILQSHDLVNVNYKKNSKREQGKVEDCDLIFLATKDEQSLIEAPKILGLEKKVIDLSGAFRISPKSFEEWYGIEHTSPDLCETAVYGLPAWYAQDIENAQLVANPGCYATSVILAIKPIAKYVAQLRINSTSGNSGARKEVEEPNEQTYAYGRQHKHVPEMEKYSEVTVHNFTSTVLRSVFRGINTNIEAQLTGEISKTTLMQAISQAYVPEDLVEVVKDGPRKIWGTKDVANTHKAVIKLIIEDNTVYITSMIDNLMKGAASQAVENMNIMLGFPRLYGISTYSIIKT